MISFEPTEEQQIARDAMHEFAAAALRPVARECDESASLPEDALPAALRELETLLATK